MNWGKIVLVDLRGCNGDFIRDEKKIKEFVVRLCDKIEIKRYGEMQIKRFGKGDLEGYSVFQFIETSSITIHFDEIKNRAFIDVFSCQDFDEKVVENFSKEFFEATDSEMKCFLRK
jgi:S-adenosylmethionine/arginine decarboxylase-like enzyme